MTIDGYKSCRKLRKQVQRKELNISYAYTKYSSLISTVSVANWLAHFPFDSYILGSSRVGRNFIFQKINWLKGDWNVTEIQLSHHHSVAIQPTLSHHLVDWKVRFHAVKPNMANVECAWVWIQSIHINVLK